jgi:hypothetical protein
VQRNIRKVAIFVGLPLAAIALAVFLLSSGNDSAQKAHAANTSAATDFSISTGSCDSNTAPKPVCNEPVGGNFTLSLKLNTQAITWAGYDAHIDWTAGLSYVNGCSGAPPAAGCTNAAAHQYNSLDTSPWPGCAFGTDEGAFLPLLPGYPLMDTGGNQVGPGSALFACADSNGAPQKFLGTLATLQFVCKAPGQATLTLVNAAGQTDIFGDTTSVETGNETLTINCQAATAVPTATPTATPPTIPFVQKLPALQNVFLTRQGTKIPPQTCEAGTDVALLNETLGGPITTLAKGQLQQLGAFEFEMRFDEKMVCVSVAAGPMFSGPTATCATVRAKGIVRFGCFTTKKNANINGPGILAIVSVKPQPELYSQLRPNQDNGIPVQILNQGCQLSDDQGHSIPISSCEDADITFRYLEGDVTGPNCAVNALDAQNIAMRWGANKGTLLYNSFLDLSPSGQIKGDGRIDIKDLQFVFGRLNSVGIRSKGGNLTCPLTGFTWPPQPAVNPKNP